MTKQTDPPKPLSDDELQAVAAALKAGKPIPPETVAALVYEISVTRLGITACRSDLAELMRTFVDGAKAMVRTNIMAHEIINSIATDGRVLSKANPN